MIKTGAARTAISSKAELEGLGPGEIRAKIRSGEWKGDSWGLAPGYAQTAFVAVPKDLAFDFMVFAQRNPGPCPLLEVAQPGKPYLSRMAKGADVRTDLAKYRVFEKGKCIAEPNDVTEYWRHDLVAFLIGCSGSFEQYLQQSGVRLRHLEEGKVGTAFVTNIPCDPAGPFHGPLVVSMRPIHWTQVKTVVQITSRFLAFHGAPIHIGDPKTIGIKDISRPDFADVLDVKEDEVPVFWACSITPQVVALEAKASFMITNYAAYMFISDRPIEAMAVIS